jgi:hypothetical protein
MKKLFLSLVLGAFGAVAVPLSAEAQVIRVTATPTFAPPAPPAEVVPPAPTAGYQWRAGFWRWNRGRYVWVPGTWTAPPRPGQIWVTPRWTVRGRVWVQQPGRWYRPAVLVPTATAGVRVAQPVPGVVVTTPRRARVVGTGTYVPAAPGVVVTSPRRRR